MAYENGTATSMADLVTKLFTFGTSNGWTQDQLVTGSGQAAMHNTGGRCFVSFRWNTSTPNNLALYQALGYGIGVSTAVKGTSGGTSYVVGDILTVAGGTKTTAATLEVLTLGASDAVATVRVATCGVNYTGNPTLTDNAVTGGSGSGAQIDLTMEGTDTLPGNGCDDSGQGYVTSTDTGAGSLDRSRAFGGIGDGPYTYWFFNDSSPDYVHVVLEITAGVFRHASFGELDKKGDWYGGEYCCGQHQGFGNPNIVDTENTVALDGRWFSTSTVGDNAGAYNRGPSIHMESVIDQAAAGKWGVIFNSMDTGTTSPSQVNDRAGNERHRMLGGLKSQPIATSLGWIASNASNGFVPMYAIAAWYWDIDLSPVELALLGFQPDVKGTNIRGFTPAQEVTIGSETWVIFPVSRKANTGDVDDSQMMGLAYKKVV